MEIKTVKNAQLGEEMYSAVHESGLRVYVFPKKGFSKYYAIYGTEYGSVDNCFRIPGQETMTTVPDGIAHYLEHKLFEQEDGGNAFDLFAQTGAGSNAFTSFDMTAYLFSCTDRFYDNLEILLQFVNHPYFTEENVAKEQGIIGQEIKMYDDDPEWRVFFNTLTAMYHTHPVRLDIAGTVESISHITPELLYTCYHTFYHPSNMVLVLAGDVDIKKVMDCVDRHVCAKKNVGELLRGTVKEPRERKQEKIEQKLMVAQPLFRIGFKDNDLGGSAQECLRKEIADELILEAAFGKSSDFIMKLYEERLIDSSFEAETERSKTYGFTLLGGESPDPEKVYDRILTHIRQLQSDGIAAEDLARAKKVLLSGHIRTFNSVERMGNAFLRQIMAGYEPLAFEEAVHAVTEDEVMARLCDHFDTENSVLSVIRPMA